MTKKSNTQIELDEFWPYQTVVLADQISRYTLRVVRDIAGLNSSQWRVLAAVADKPGRSAAEVTSVTPMDKTIVSRAVASLIKTGMIQKSKSTNDKRSSSLTTTETGLKIYKQISMVLNRTLIDSIEDKRTAANFIQLLKNYSEHVKFIDINDNASKL